MKPQRQTTGDGVDSARSGQTDVAYACTATTIAAGDEAVSTGMFVPEANAAVREPAGGPEVTRPRSDEFRTRKRSPLESGITNQRGESP